MTKKDPKKSSKKYQKSDQKVTRKESKGHQLDIRLYCILYRDIDSIEDNTIIHMHVNINSIQSGVNTLSTKCKANKCRHVGLHLSIITYSYFYSFITIFKLMGNVVCFFEAGCSCTQRNFTISTHFK